MGKLIAKKSVRCADDGGAKNCADVIGAGVDSQAFTDAPSRSPLFRENVKTRRFSRSRTSVGLQKR